MGKNGKPFFISGPFQSPAECEMVVAKLAAFCGAGGYGSMEGLDAAIAKQCRQGFDELSFDNEDVTYQGDDEDDDETEDADEITSPFRFEDRRA